ncbi:MAG TPA: hypothetical protein VF699_07825 [Caulobacteraceae bacterium]|jgi:hypothetical protein
MIKQDVPGWDHSRPRHSRYAVIRYGHEWRLLYGTATIGQFPTPEAAMEVADKLCRAVANVGFDVDLTVHTQNGELRSERIASRLKP